MNRNKKIKSYLVPGITGWFLLLVATLLWAYWGIGEVFHEGWYPPYTHIIYYFIPFLCLLGMSAMCIYLPLVGGIIIIAGGILYLVLNVIRAGQQHVTLLPSFWVVPAIVIIPGILFLSDYILKKRHGYSEPKKFVFRNKWKILAIIVLSFILIIGVGTPFLIRNLGRLPLENFNEVVIEEKELTLIFASDGTGWYYSNDSPIIFEGKEYRSFSWNEIALFGKDTIGFEGKRYGPDYDGTRESIYYATQEDFNEYNMFRYITYDGKELTREVQDYWKLPSADEYVRMFMYRGKNAGGYFDSNEGRAYYEKTPDKEGPIWAPDKMVIYYWTSTSFDDENAYDITYSGEVRKISKITKQDYRGWRAVRVLKLNKKDNLLIFYFRT